MSSTESVFLCPRCRSDLPFTVPRGAAACPACARRADAPGGVIDLLPDRANVLERGYYDSFYAAAPTSADRDFDRAWQSLYYPMNRSVLKHVGDLRGKRVLLLGNGMSEKELLFLDQHPDLLIFSDLSPAAVRTIREHFFPEPRQDLVFAAIDALELPIADGAVDVVYGYAFVHHLPDVRRFLTEVTRVLRPGGRAVFMDDAYSPLWQGAKRTVLSPLMRYFHRLQQPSPEDLRFTLAGGFREEVLAGMIRALGCEPWFERSGFVHYLVTRASERLPPQRAWRALVASEHVLRTLIKADEWIARLPGMRRNQIRLVWGFDKPLSSAAGVGSVSG